MCRFLPISRLTFSTTVSAGMSWCRSATGARI
jgi:hypothetical protein